MSIQAFCEYKEVCSYRCHRAHPWQCRWIPHMSTMKRTKMLAQCNSALVMDTEMAKESCHCVYSYIQMVMVMVMAMAMLMAMDDVKMILYFVALLNSLICSFFRRDFCVFSSKARSFSTRHTSHTSDKPLKVSLGFSNPSRESN